MRRWVVALLVTCSVAAALAVETGEAPPAGAATTVLNFDELAANSALTTQYASRGVTFNVPGATVVSNTTLSRSDPNHIVCRLNPEFCSGPVAGTFSPSQQRVKVWVGHIGTGSARVTLRAFNAAGALIGQSFTDFAISRFSQPITRPLEVSVPTAVIKSFDVTSNDFNENTIIDDLEFQRPDPTLTLNPDCRGSTAQTLTVTAQGFTPNSNGYVNYDPKGPEEQARIRIPIDANGSFSTAFNTTASGRAILINANDLDNNRTEVTWSPCPPPGVTTTSTTTTTPSTTTSTTIRTTGSTTTTSTTIPTVVTIPPPTPGATLTVDPPLGPGGFVTKARGTGFPANQLIGLGWSPGIGLFVAQAGPDGTFETQVLVMKRDILGPRTLVATSGAVSASTVFLVLPSTVHPSGKDVAQINRTRRFLNR